MNQRPEAIVTHPALIPIAGNYDRKPRTMDRDVTVIGRARGSDLCLEANEVSTLHCIIYRGVDGFRIRDCGSRTGTRVNGETVKNHTLRDTDIINIGPFSFEIRIPPMLFPKDSAKFDPGRIAHWVRSRRQLALRALKLRKRLLLRADGVPDHAENLTWKASQLQSKIRSFGSRGNELEEAERELEEERAKLLNEREAHRDHVHKIETGIADRLAQTDKEIRQRWQEFQQRCQTEESRLNKLAAAVTIMPAKAFAGSGDEKANGEQQRLWEEERKRLQTLETQLNHQQQQLQCERQEFLSMKDQWGNSQVQAIGAQEAQKAALAQQEAAVRAQKGELMRMMGELKKMQEDLRKQPRGDARSLQVEVDRLHQENAQLHQQLQGHANPEEVNALLDENERLRAMVDQLQHNAGQPVPAGMSEDALHEMDEVRAENQSLKKLVQERDQSLAALEKRLQSKPLSENDLDREERELNDYRRQLESDRSKLNQEVELLRERNRELDDAIREMEMEMSKERAELGRERSRLDRVREEIKADMERLQREIAVRDSMAPLQKLRDEIKQPAPNGKALNDRLRSFRNQLAE